MKRKIEVTVGSLSDALHRFEQARWTLLEAVKRSGPMSINELARLLGRNYKNVHTDVGRLIDLGRDHYRAAAVASSARVYSTDTPVSGSCPWPTTGQALNNRRFDSFTIFPREKDLLP